MIQLNQNFIAKARQDPFYQSVINNFGVGALASAGFFDDGSKVGLDMANRIDHRLPVTSLSKVATSLREYERNKRSASLAILISSGAFCPLHDGHIQMMDSAKVRLEQAGYFVAGGFICPDHDQYIYSKYGHFGIPAEKRVELAEQALATNSWLAVDPWSACYLDRSINFTDIVRRFKAYLSEQFTNYPDIDVFFICGSDNAGFYQAFIDQGGLVIVPRKNNQLDFDTATLSKHKIFIADQHTANDLNATSIRQAAIEHETQNKAYHSISIFIRDEGELAIGSWIDKYGIKVANAKQNLLLKLRALIENNFSSEYPKAAVHVPVLEVRQQAEQLQRFLRYSQYKTISLDPYTKADFNLGISRVFSLTDNQRLVGLHSRPGCKSIEQQIAEIPAGTYNLVEDDIATGNTIKEFLKLLPSDIKIDQIVALNQLSTGEVLNTVESELVVCHAAIEESRLSDIVDLRDFIIGSENGGLVVKLPDGSVARAPYMLPYVKNTDRMSLPVMTEYNFSEQLWKINYEFFIEIGDQIRVSDCHESFRQLAKYLNFMATSKLSDFCLWHMKQFEVRHGMLS